MIYGKKAKMNMVGRAYRHRIEVLEFKEVQNEMYQWEQRLVKNTDIYADIIPIKGREYNESEILVSETVYRLKTHYLPNLRTDMYIHWQINHCDKYLQITSIIDVDGQEIEMEIIAKEVQRPSGS